MATTMNGHSNGINGVHSSDHVQPLYPRYSHIPADLEIPVHGGEGDEAVTLDLTVLADDIEELCGLLEAEHAPKKLWITIALAYARQKRPITATDILRKALSANEGGKSEDRLSILTCLCWLQLWRCRHAPRVRPSQPRQHSSGEELDDRTKDECLHAATSVLNEASRISPSYAPLFMARGTLYLLRASLQQPTKTGPGSSDHSERTDTLRQALKCFDDALRVNGGTNVMALLGKAKAQYSLGHIPSALSLYQQALERAPDMLDPDPRIGIGACLWSLGHKDQALAAWERSLTLNPDSVIANSLLGVYYLDQANSYSISDPEFKPLYQKSMTEHTQTAFKKDGMHALTCAQFVDYFLRRRNWDNVERLARRAIELTDVNAIASDGWYLLALQSHYQGDLQKASEHYQKADQARGGDERGFIPAKFGAAQLRTLGKDLDGAKFRLEKIVEKNKNVEAMTLLGILFAEDVFNSQQGTGPKEDKTQEAKRAIAMLEQVRVMWKDTKKKIKREAPVLLNLARLYEGEETGKALACLKEAEEMMIADIPDEDLPEDMGEDEDERQIRREMLPPQLLNNIGCFHFANDKFADAKEDFQSALNACVKLKEKRAEQEEENGGMNGDSSSEGESEALLTTISYNLARTYEAEGLDSEARQVYEGTLVRHPDYIDARMRLAYLTLKADPTEGAEAVKALLDSDPDNLEVRALYGWFLHGSKKKTMALNEDAEQRHYKHTLQTLDKHDTYALTGMGNLHLAVAREMPRDNEQHKEKRSKMYLRAVEFYDKVLQLDPRNAFAAQGLAIAVVEEKKDPAAAIQILSRVRESVKDEASVHVNLGHVFTEMKQYTRAIENYELALVKSRTSAERPSILACLGRVWLVRGRQEKRLEAYKTALDLAQQAHALAPNNVNYRFNVAFVQMQLAQMLIALPEAQRTLEDVEAAGAGLEDAIEAFGAIAKEPNPPFPRGDIEQRANMGRNTMKRQLASAVEKQAEYERVNADRLAEAKRKREEERQRRAEAEQAEAKRKAEEMRRMKEERERMSREDEELRARREEEERERKAAEEAAFTTDEETGEKKKREKRKAGGKRKKKDDLLDDEGGVVTTGNEGTGSEVEGGARRRTKKRKLETRKGRATNSKYKSADVVEDSDEDEDGGAAAAAASQKDDEDAMEEDAMEEDGEEAAQRLAARSMAKRRVIDDDEEDEEEGGVPAAGESDHGGDAIE